MECVVCSHQSENWVALQCGHLLCDKCSKMVQKCPFCRADITTRSTVFINATVVPVDEGSTGLREAVGRFLLDGFPHGYPVTVPSAPLSREECKCFNDLTREFVKWHGARRCRNPFDSDMIVAIQSLGVWSEARRDLQKYASLHALRVLNTDLSGVPEGLRAPT